jgi:hypothetical protein
MISAAIAAGFILATSSPSRRSVGMPEDSTVSTMAPPAAVSVTDTSSIARRVASKRLACSVTPARQSLISRETSSALCTGFSARQSCEDGV